MTEYVVPFVSPVMVVEVAEPLTVVTIGLSMPSVNVIV